MSQLIHLSTTKQHGSKHNTKQQLQQYYILLHLCNVVFSLLAFITSSLNDRCCLWVVPISSCSLLMCSRNVPASWSIAWLVASSSAIFLDSDLLSWISNKTSHATNINSITFKYYQWDTGATGTGAIWVFQLSKIKLKQKRGPIWAIPLKHQPVQYPKDKYKSLLVLVHWSSWIAPFSLPSPPALPSSSLSSVPAVDHMISSWW